MKNHSKANSSKREKQEELIQKAMHNSGFLFPETIEEVEEFERIYGTTAIILPEVLRTPVFPDDLVTKKPLEKLMTAPKLAMAAKGAKHKMTDEVSRQMAAERRVADAKFEKRSNGPKTK